MVNPGATVAPAAGGTVVAPGARAEAGAIVAEPGGGCGGGTVVAPGATVVVPGA